MSGLANIQRDFCQFAKGHGHKDFLCHIKTASLPKEALLNVYHNNIFSVHRRSLENDYPLVFSIMGPVSARSMARAYTEASFPCTGSLSDWGGGFSAFIQRYEPAAVWPYLADIAQYEWAKHLAYGIGEGPLLTVEDMKKMMTLAYHELIFRFQKSCQLKAFSYPLESILATYQKDQGVPPPTGQEASYALILKHQGIIKVYWLSPALFAFLNRLKEGQDIEVAFAAAQVLEPQFDAQAAFSFLFSNPILCR